MATDLFLHNNCGELRRVALQIARAREMLNWFGTFYAVASVGMLTGFRHTRKPGVLVPLLPLTFIFGYQVDMAYGNKLLRIKRKQYSYVHSICCIKPF